MATIEDLQEAVSGIAAGVGGSVVGVGHRWAHGSGVVIAPGRVLTNAHNIRGDELTVTFSDARTAKGKPRGVDVDGDLAVIDVDTGDAKPIEWSDGAEAGIGLPVFALANPNGQGLRVTFGLVSGTQRAFRGPRGRLIAGSLEHTAPLLPGSSGGPVVDARGRLLGLNTNRLGEGFYLAIPADAALRGRAEALARGETPARPRLGVAIAPAHVARKMRAAVGLPDADGLLVRGVDEKGPAASAGIKEGDLLIEAGGRHLATVDDLFAVLAAGAALEIKILRGTEERSVTVTPSSNGRTS